jgi:hypothetical protein
MIIIVLLPLSSQMCLGEKISPIKSTTINIVGNHEQLEQSRSHTKPMTREVAVQHVVVDKEPSPPPLPPKQRTQRDVAINHRTEYDDDDSEEKQKEIIRRKLEEIKTVYNERIHVLEERIVEQEKDLERLSQPKLQRHVNTQCQPAMYDRALVTDTFRTGSSSSMLVCPTSNDRMYDSAISSSRCCIDMSPSSDVIGPTASS